MNLVRLTIAGAISVCLLIAAILAAALWYDRNDRLQRAEKESTEFARTLAGHAARTFGTVDILLDLLSDRFVEAERDGLLNSTYVYNRLREYEGRLPQLTNAGMIGRDGRSFANVQSPRPPPIDLSDRDYFRAHRDGAATGLYIGAPIRARSDNQMVVVVSRRYDSVLGGFGGVLTGVVSPAYFRQYYDATGDAGGEYIALVNGNGVVIASSSLLDQLSGRESVGARLDALPIFAAGSGESRTSLQVASVADWPLTVAVSFNPDRVLQPWRRDAWLLSGAAVGVAAIICLLAFLVLRSLRREADGTRAVAAANERFNLAVLASNAGVWDRDAETGSLALSPRLLDILGVRDRETILTYDDFARRIHPDDGAKVAAALERHAERSELPFEAEYRMRRDDGRYIWCQGFGYAIRSPDGRTTRFVGLIFDITARKTAELTLREGRAQLERQAEELRAAHAAATAERVRAEEANRSKSEFLAMMSHELRTPLTAILGFAEVIRDDSFGPAKDGEYREYAKYIHDGGTVLLGLINDVLDLAKIEAGRFELHPETIQSRELVRSSLSLVKAAAHERHVELAEEISPNATSVWADPRAAKQIMANLLSNAVKFTPAGGKVMIRIDPAPAAGVEVAVIDSGIGMTAEQIAQAFEAYGQIDNLLVRDHSGPGLGLPLVKRLADLHGATFTLESTPGRGTIATVRFPPLQTGNP